MHREASRRVKEAASNLGLKQVATDPAFAANGMTAVSGRVSLVAYNAKITTYSSIILKELLLDK